MITYNSSSNQVWVVDDFHTFSRTKLSSRKLFDSSAYCFPESATQLHDKQLTMLKSASELGPTPFDCSMEELARSGHFLQHITLIIDCRSDRLPSLSQRTLTLRGCLDTMRCYIYSQHTFQITPESFQDRIHAPCPMCEENEKIREANKRHAGLGKRLRSVGFLRPNVLLYGEENPDEAQIVDTFNKDLHHPIDAVIIVGTRLYIRSLRQYVEDIYEAAKSDDREITVVWVNKERPTLGQRFQSLLTHEFIGDCDDFASILA
jgi:NAD-dependent SIR2 family protein deacetylase